MPLTKPFRSFTRPSPAKRLSSRQVSKFCGSTGSKEKSGSRLAVLRTFKARSKYSKFTAAAGSRVGATCRPSESKNLFPEARLLGFFYAEAIPAIPLGPINAPWRFWKPHQAPSSTARDKLCCSPYLWRWPLDMCMCLCNYGVFVRR